MSDRLKNRIGEILNGAAPSADSPEPAPRFAHPLEERMYERGSLAEAIRSFQGEDPFFQFEAVLESISRLPRPLVDRGTREALIQQGSSESILELALVLRSARQAALAWESTERNRLRQAHAGTLRSQADVDREEVELIQGRTRILLEALSRFERNYRDEDGVLYPDGPDRVIAGGIRRFANLNLEAHSVQTEATLSLPAELHVEDNLQAVHTAASRAVRIPEESLETTPLGVEMKRLSIQGQTRAPRLP